MDRNGLKLEKIGPFFSSFDAMSSKITKKSLWSVLPDEIHLIRRFARTHIICCGSNVSERKFRNIFSLLLRSFHDNCVCLRNRETLEASKFILNVSATNFLIPCDRDKIDRR